MFEVLQTQKMAGNIFIDPEFKELRDYLGSKRKKFSTVFILADSNTKKYCLDSLHGMVPQLVKSEVIELPRGEKNKNIRGAEFIWQKLMDHGADRNSLLVNLGGGVVSDIGGFAASVFKRGISFINVPTSLMAQLDAAIGGKTALNVGTVKNQVGTFSRPKGVFINPSFIRTLPLREFNSGFCEAFKHGLIADQAYYELLKVIKFPLRKTWPEIIIPSVKIKSAIVAEDPLEENKRKVLNFGHTIGHALESLVNRKQQMSITHGEAVAAGIVCESFISNQQCDLAKNELDDIVATVFSNFYPLKLRRDYLPEIIDLIRQDKKTTYGKTGFTLLNGIGKAIYDQAVSKELIEMSLNFYREKADGFFKNP